MPRGGPCRSLGRPYHSLGRPFCSLGRPFRSLGRPCRVPTAPWGAPYRHPGPPMVPLPLPRVGAPTDTQAPYGLRHSTLPRHPYKFF